MRFISLLTVGIFLFLEIGADYCKRCPKNHSCKHVVCPSLLPAGDLSVPADLKAAQILIIQKLWNTTYPELTSKGNDLKSSILKMATSDVYRWRMTALATSVWFWSVSPFYESNVDFCMFSKSINSTVLSQTQPACDLILGALNGFITMVTDRMRLITSTGVKAADCGSIEATPRAPDCYKNGTVYLGKELWKLKGDDYPCSYEKAVRRLLRSSKPLDKLLAVMGTASISTAGYRFVINYNQKVLMEIFHLQTMPNIDCCCCEAFVNAIKAIESVGIAEAKKSVDKTKLEFPECLS